ncbi:hypothetical protein SAY87_016675 [Trapa incisa]|uniref:GDSL esterase/lipase n=1 Tax=Trapa incisa TaxID=236973 RepID=A0AAN7LAH1_9MYRT|nr:hypothetical protein SAY87_016675 [Trapa incisa]
MIFKAITYGWMYFLVTFLQLSGNWLAGGMSQGSQTVPAIFVFGDSLVDVGNTNFLRSLAKANYYPYGIDSPRGPSGRFCNGKTMVDIIDEMLGLPNPPAYTDPSTRGNRILGGVNYASAAGGILDETGRHLGQRFSLSQQVLNFQSTLNQIRNMMYGPEIISKYLAKSIVILNLGSNDYINNYLLPPIYNTSYIYNPQQFANLLINGYTRQILRLHSLGLRKMFIAGIGPLGCIPNQRAFWQSPPDRCVDFVNQMLGSFNEGLRLLVDRLNGNHPGAIFVYGNSYAALGDILNTPQRYGFTVVDRACCEIWRNRGQITCTPFTIPCSNRIQSVFWDAFHPTEAANAWLAKRAFSGPRSDCYPINIQQMSLL